jgi:DNA-binding MarR family transcriptional regulator
VEPAGISVAQYNVLRILRGAGTDGLPTLAIRDRMIEEAPAITRLLDKLDAAGLVLRDRGEDRRQVRCTISADGLALLAGLDAAVSAVDETVLGAIPDPELHTLLALLGAIHDPRDGSGVAD